MGMKRKKVSLLLVVGYWADDLVMGGSGGRGSAGRWRGWCEGVPLFGNQRKGLMAVKMVFSGGNHDCVGKRGCEWFGLLVFC